MWLLELAAVRAEGGCFVLTSHPFLSGRPARAAALGDIMAEAVSAGDVWITTMARSPRMPAVSGCGRARCVLRSAARTAEPLRNGKASHRQA